MGQISGASNRANIETGSQLGMKEVVIAWLTEEGSTYYTIF